MATGNGRDRDLRLLISCPALTTSSETPSAYQSPTHFDCYIIYTYAIMHDHRIKKVK
jgi:hypothetical protein